MGLEAQHEQFSRSLTLPDTALSLLSVLKVGKRGVLSFIEPGSFIFTGKTHTHKPPSVVTLFEEIHKLCHIIEYVL